MIRECVEMLERIVAVLFLCVEFVSRAIFKLIYRRKGASMPPINNLLFLDSASSIACKIRTQKLTSVDVLKSFIERIAEINPTLNCVVAHRFEEALKEAMEADALIRSGTLDVDAIAKQKPFLGVPFTTKDCIAVKGMIQTSGLYSRREEIAEQDAASIALLRKAGAIPIALTNVSELCMWWESNNPVHGRTNNPYDANRIVGGSSGGEGCAQAACASAFGVGSDIGGSIRMPAFFNGVFGHKPSQFIVSNEGQYPKPSTAEQESFLSIGPLCRRSEDLKPLLRVMAGENAICLRLDDPVDLKTIRYFYQDSDMGAQLVSPVSEDIRLLFAKIAAHLKKAHNKKVQEVSWGAFKHSTQLWLFNMKSPMLKFQQELCGAVGYLTLPIEFVRWMFGYSNHTFIALCTAIAENWGPGYGSPTYNKFVEMRNRFRRQLSDLLGEDGVLLYPTHPTAAPFHNEPIFKAFNFSYTGIVNVLQFPATHVPLGLDANGLPIGVQVIANDKCDRLCLAVARELEKAFGGWQPPAIDVDNDVQ